MIEVFLIKDKTHYLKEQLDVMERVFAKNFITYENPELEANFNPVSPETRIQIKLTKGALPELLFRALGEDLSNLVTNKDFFDAFARPNSKETPSLVFHFVGDLRSYEFRIRSKSKKSLKEGSEKIAEKLLSMLTQEDIPPESTDRHSFRYSKGVWTEVT